MPISFVPGSPVDDSPAITAPSAAWVRSRDSGAGRPLEMAGGGRLLVAFAHAPGMPPWTRPASPPSAKAAETRMPGFAIAAVKNASRLDQRDGRLYDAWARRYRHHRLVDTGSGFVAALAELTRESETGEIDFLVVFGHGRQGTISMLNGQGLYYPCNTDDIERAPEGENARRLDDLEALMFGPAPTIRFSPEAVVIFTGCCVGADVLVDVATYDSFAAGFAKRIVPGGTVYAATGLADSDRGNPPGGGAGWFVSLASPWRKWVKGKETLKPWEGPQPEGAGRMTPPMRDGSGKLKVW